MTDKTHARLKKIVLFAGLSARTLDRVAEAVIPRHFAAGTQVLLAGDRCTTVYFVAAGTVRVYRLSIEGREQVLIHLAPGQALKLHLTPVDAFFYVLEGEGVVEIGGEQEHVHQDQLIPSPAKISHRLWNESDAPFRFLMVKTPRQKEKSRLL